VLVHSERLTQSVRVEDVVTLVERVVGLGALLVERDELVAVLDEAIRSVEVQELRRAAAHIPEGVDNARWGKHERPRRGADDLVSRSELELPLEDLERVAVPAVQMGLDLAAGLDLELDQRELWASSFDDVRPDPLAFAETQDDRFFLADRLLDEAFPVIPGHA